MDPVLSYDFGEIEYSVRQEIHTTSARFNAALDELRSQIAPLRQLLVRPAAPKRPPGGCLLSSYTGGFALCQLCYVGISTFSPDIDIQLRYRYAIATLPFSSFTNQEGTPCAPQSLT